MLNCFRIFQIDVLTFFLPVEWTFVENALKAIKSHYKINKIEFYHEMSGLIFLKLSNIIALMIMNIEVRNQMERSKHLKKMLPRRLISTSIAYENFIWNFDHCK